MSTQRHVPLLEDIKRYGAVVWEDLVARHPGSTRIIRDGVRRTLLHVDTISSIKVLSLGYLGRKHFGMKSNRPLSATTLLDELAARVVTHHYEDNNWILDNQYARNIRRYTHPEHQTEYAIVKRSNYTRKHLDELVMEVFNDVMHDHAHLIYYTYADVKEDDRNMKLTHRSFLPLLERASPPVRHLLTDVTV